MSESKTSTSTPSYKRGGPGHLVTGNPLDRGDLRRHVTENPDIIPYVKKKNQKDHASRQREVDHHLSWISWSIRRDNLVAGIRALENESKRLLSEEWTMKELRMVGEESRNEITDVRRRMGTSDIEERSLVQALLLIKNEQQKR